MNIQDGIDRIDSQQFEKVEESLKSILATEFELRALKAKLYCLESDMMNKRDFIFDTLGEDYFENELTFCITLNGRDYYSVSVYSGQINDFIPIVRPKEPEPELAYKPYDLPDDPEHGNDSPSVNNSYSLDK